MVLGILLFIKVHIHLHYKYVLMSTFLSRSFSSDISELLESFDQTDVAMKITDFSLYIAQHSSSSLLNTLFLNREGGGRGRKKERERERKRKALDAMNVPPPYSYLCMGISNVSR